MQHVLLLNIVFYLEVTGIYNQTVSVEIKSDKTVEKNETFNVELFGPTSGAKIGRNVTTITIINDDCKAQQLLILDLLLFSLVYV